MKAIQKLAIFAVILMAVGFAKADALYWQVDTTSSDAKYTGTFDSAGLYTSGGDYIDGAVANADGRTSTPQLSDLGSYGSSSYSFYIELYNASGVSVYKTESLSYDSLVASGYVSGGGVALPTFTATSGFNGASVPEPTSGVLLLIGGAMLALRRRRRA